jgi:hypothetical protein
MSATPFLLIQSYAPARSDIPLVGQSLPLANEPLPRPGAADNATSPTCSVVKRHSEWRVRSHRVQSAPASPLFRRPTEAGKALRGTRPGVGLFLSRRRYHVGNCGKGTRTVNAPGSSPRLPVDLVIRPTTVGKQHSKATASCRASGGNIQSEGANFDSFKTSRQRPWQRSRRLRTHDSRC